MRQTRLVAQVEMAFFFAICLASPVLAGDVTQKGKLFSAQKHAVQRVYGDKGVAQKGNVQKGVAYQKGYDTCDKHACGCEGRHSWLHCKKHQAPHAPIMGSAPAMMAPVILVRNETQRAPRDEDRDQEDELDRLKKIIEALDDLIPERQAPARATSKSDDSEAIEQIAELLKKQDQRLETQKANQKELAKHLDQMILVLNGLNSKIGEIEKQLEEKEAVDDKE